jgi:hypothetical protein
MGGIKISVVNVVLDFRKQGQGTLIGVQVRAVFIRVNPIPAAPVVDI